MKALRFVLRGARGMVVLAVAGSTVGGLAGAVLVALLQRAIQAPSGARGALGLLFAATWATGIGARVVSDLRLARFVQERAAELRVRLSNRITATPLPTVERVGAARLLATLTEDVGAIVAIMTAALSVAPQLMILVGCLAYMAWLSPLLFAFAVGTLSLGIAASRLVDRRGRREVERQRAAYDDMMKNFQVVTDAAKELRACTTRRDAFLRDMLEPSVRNLADSSRRAAVSFSLAGHCGNLAYVSMMASVVFVAPSFTSLPAGVVMGYTLAALYLAGPVTAVLGFLPHLARADASLRRIEQIVSSLEPEARAEPGAPLAPRSWRRIDLEGVRYTYERQGEAEPFHVGPVDLTLRPGEVVFVVGGNGSGKTTLAKVLAGLYPLSAGARRVDGLPVGPSEEQRYREMFSATYADSFLFDRLLGFTNVDEGAREYLELLDLASKVKIDNGRFTTTKLSRGQRKRLLLLCAWLEDREVYVFDEWAADQDPQFRHLFYTRFLPELRARGKAVVAITHDDAYFAHADRIVKLDRGSVVEQARRAA
jgi:putative ATP-binding cassette transporter